MICNNCYTFYALAIFCTLMTLYVAFIRSYSKVLTISCTMCALIISVLLGKRYITFAPLFWGMFVLLFRKEAVEFYLLSFFSLAGGILAVSANNFILLTIGIELLYIPLYVLVAKKDHVFGMKYFLIGVIASSLIIFGLSFACIENKSLAITMLTPNKLPILLVTIGFLIKLGIVPFHFWIIKVYESVSLLYIVVLDMIPKFFIGYICFELIGEYYTYFAIASAIIGAIGALACTNLLSFLSLSTISNMGFAMMASQELFIIFHATYCVTMLVIVYACEHYSIRHIEDFSKVTNIWHKVFLTIVIGSLIGLPPLWGFWPKLFILQFLINEYIRISIASIAMIFTAIYWLYPIRRLWELSKA